ncbi:MAG: N-acetylneuraminate synthase family protein [Ferrovibrio sp.]
MGIREKNMTSISLIAEIGSVHDGSVGNAKKLIEAAAECGATAVKFQTHIAEAETLPNAPSPPYFKGEPRLEYFRRTGFSLQSWLELKQVALDCGVEFLSSPFSLEAVDLLEQIGVDTYKIPSGEVTNIPLLRHVAATGKQTLLSSGMSSWAELDNAVAVLRNGGPLTIMQCTSAYPCPPEQVGLNVLAEMRARYSIPVGYSDHTMSNTSALAAALAGATVIEKHFTFSRLMYGSDAKNACEPPQFRELALALREITAMATPVDKDAMAASLIGMKAIFEKSIVSARPIKAGQPIEYADLAFKKPGDGISAAEYEKYIGRICLRDLPENHKFETGDFQ